MKPNKPKLGQHWLFDQPTLRAMAKAADVGVDDVVLEIGPGPGSLTELLVAKAKQVVAVEKDELLAADLGRRLTADNLEIHALDIRDFNLTNLPHGYKVVANIPYYLTSHLIRNLLESANPPSLMVLMIQKEVAERIVARPPAMSLLAFSVRYYGQPKMLAVIPKELFRPPPQVDSAILQISRRPTPYFAADRKALFRLVKAGFSSKRKQLKNSLSAGLQIAPAKAETLLHQAKITPTRRAQELSLDDWQRLYKIMTKELMLA